MKIYKELLQGSPEWHQVRDLKFTASKATPVGANGAGLKTLVNELVAKAIVPEDLDARYVSPDMERGNLLEPLARTRYEFANGVEVEVVGFIERDKYTGFSPDGLVGKDGLIEIKARNDAKHLEILRTQKVESEVRNQIQFQLWVSGRAWCDYISYNPNFKNSLAVIRLVPDPAYFSKLEVGHANGVKLLEEYLADPNIKKELAK